MAKNKISDWNVNPVYNTDIAGIDIDEGCAPSGINNAIRTVMAQVKDLQAGTSGDTLPIAAGGTGTTSFPTGIIKGAGTSALSAATAGTDYTTPTGTESLSNKTITASPISGSTGAFTSLNANATTTLGEVATVAASAATGTINYDIKTQGVVYYTSSASGNWTLNFRGDGSTTLNSLMAVGEVRTVTFVAAQGSTAYYNNAITIDSTSVTAKWQGGSAPTSGNASGLDTYTYSIIKTASATYTVLASLTQFKQDFKCL